MTTRNPVSRNLLARYDINVARNQYWAVMSDPSSSPADQANWRVHYDKIRSMSELYHEWWNAPENQDLIDRALQEALGEGVVADALEQPSFVMNHAAELFDMIDSGTPREWAVAYLTGEVI